MNLLKETNMELKLNGKTWEDVLWVGNSSEYMTPEEFKKRAGDIDYDDGYGLSEIDESLIVVGDNWWLERYEYDGSEGWSYKEHPAKPESHNRNLSIKWR